MGGNQTLHYTSLGELIKMKREDTEISLSELGRLSGVHKSALARIENGETKQPKLQTIKAIADVLELPYKEIVEHYIKIEQRAEVLQELILEAIEVSQFQLIPNVAQKVLASPNEDTYISLERLYNFVDTIVNNEIKLLLYGEIITYARQYGVPKYIAKGLLEKYLIDREDFKRLEKSYKDGEEIAYYVDFLSLDEQITFYYRMSLHAHNIKKYEKCIKFGQMGMEKDKTKNDLKESVALAMCNSYVELEDHVSLHLHLDECEKKKYHFIIRCINYYGAIILSQRGDYEKAIPLLQECLEEVIGIRRLYRLNRLLEALSKSKNVDLIRKLVQSEENDFSFNPVTPHQYAQAGMYYNLKELFLLKMGNSI
ncbi:helix-turn-helix domain-containing protein [Brevibacillus laterosporus]|uniref:Helix-turn-helix transcriptional regulator n=1 Tax=Brevibacillus halotolerans TaxID=1507437 RepID=A0ABT4I0S4_9BACL|nr:MULTISPECIES: helix-turn-helix transcriptional regulator [Brevibacillus]MCR8986926.1 helix-turn-helix domain-containing protein [Brevibacillus laterosporus]MCZ0832662.1 helix-turn-helix transcriptional regulator [Brevibacillus halotolerans]